MRSTALAAVIFSVSAWAAFAWSYIGVEDGSTGMTPFAWIAMAFLMPGVILCRVFGIGYNATMLWPVLFSLMVYLPGGLLIAQGVHWFRKSQEE